MRAVLHRTLSVFTSLCLFAGACTIEDAGDIEGAGDIERFDVVNTNEIVEDGVSLHTFESEEMTYSVRIHAVRDGIVFHHTVESDGDHYGGSITYEIVTTDDGGAEMHPIGDADVVFGEIYSRVAGSSIEDYLLSDELDLTKGITGDLAYRASCWWLGASVITACSTFLGAAVILGFLSGGILSAGTIVIYGPLCAVTMAAYVDNGCVGS